MAARAVVRDVARAQGKSYGLADRLAKMIPFQSGNEFEKALKDNSDLRRILSKWMRMQLKYSKWQKN